jgi:hypothetical protein
VKRIGSLGGQAPEGVQEADDEGAVLSPSREVHLALRSKLSRRMSGEMAAQQDVGRILVGQAPPDDSPRSRIGRGSLPYCEEALYDRRGSYTPPSTPGREALFYGLDYRS